MRKRLKNSKNYKEFLDEKTKLESCIKNIESILAPGLNTQQLCKTTKPLGELKHALGHGIGLEVHDFPSGIGCKSKFKLREGMVLAIEPALYIKNFGIRIENDYEITKKGFRRLG